MDLTTLFQTAYTVCFILAGVLFATAVFVFFRFNILGVIESLSGIKMPQKRKRSEKNAHVPSAKKRGGGSGDPSTESLVSSKVTPQTGDDGGNTVWLDERETGSLDDIGVDELTGELDKTTGTLDNTELVNDSEAAARAIAAIRFVPQRKVMVIQTKERA